MRWLATGFACLLAATASAAVPTAAIDRYIVAEMARQRIPGLALAVLQHGRPLYVHGYGVASLEWPNRVEADTRFQIGSIGKQFTAVAVMLLVRDGRLELDAPLAHYLPEVPASWSGVTLRRMLAHQSGIAQLDGDDRRLLDLRHEYSDEEYVRLAASQPLEFEPGTDADYSDTAYVLLGVVIGRVTGRFYGELLAERVFAPLGMERTQVISDEDIVVKRASGYELDAAGRLRNQSFVSAALNRTADGSLYSTVHDLARWDAALYGARVLPRDVLDRMWRVDPLAGGEPPLYHYGYGWEINHLRAQTVIEYDGNWQGFQAAMARYPGRELSVIVLTNRSLCRAQAIAHSVAGYVDAALRPVEAASRDANPQATERLRALLEAARAGDEDARPAALTARRWRALGRDLRAVGDLARLEFAGETVRSDGVERRYRAELTSMVEIYTLRQAADGSIRSLDVEREH